MNNPHQRLLDYYFSSERDFESSSKGVQLRYILCSSPRSGSSLISDMLFRTALAGDPLEYLNIKMLEYYGKLHPELKRIEEYLKHIEARRTSSNGVFGIKLHFYQARMIWQGKEAEGVRHLARYDKRILVTRRDKVAQAVSLYRAQKTQIWSSEDRNLMSLDDPRRGVKVAYDQGRIARALAQIENEEAGWRFYLRQANLSYKEICYEDFIADYKRQSVELLKSLGVDATVNEIVKSGLKRQSKEHDPMIEMFRQDAGLHC